MTFILVELDEGRCLVFYTRRQMDKWLRTEYVDEETISNYCYFIVPDDFCIPIRLIDGAEFITEALHNAGFESLRLDENPS